MKTEAQIREHIDLIESFWAATKAHHGREMPADDRQHLASLRWVLGEEGVPAHSVADELRAMHVEPRNEEKGAPIHAGSVQRGDIVVIAPGLDPVVVADIEELSESRGDRRVRFRWAKVDGLPNAVTLHESTMVKRLGSADVESAEQLMREHGIDWLERF